MKETTDKIFLNKETQNPLTFKDLLKLEREHKITIGVNRNHTNNFWYRTTIQGKVFNLLLPLLVVLDIVVFVYFGLWYGILATIFIVFYIKAINYISCMRVRQKLFGNEQLFKAAYETKLITIRDNETGDIQVFSD